MCSFVREFFNNIRGIAYYEKRARSSVYKENRKFTLKKKQMNNVLATDVHGHLRRDTVESSKSPNS